MSEDQHLYWDFGLFHGPYPSTIYYEDANQPQNGFNYCDVYTREDRSSHSDGMYSHAFCYPHDFSGSSMRVYSSVNDCCQDEADTGPSSSGSSPGHHSGAGEEWSDLSNDYPANDEMEKKLYQMVPIRHVPRINGAIPSNDEATTDHQRLSERIYFL